MKNETDLPLTPDDVAEIVAVLAKGTHDKLEIETPRFRLSLARGESGQWTQSWQSQQQAGVAAGAAKPAVVAADAAAPLADEPGLAPLRPPLPGTFYRAPKPGAAPFVQVGDQVEADTVVCIIETMKLMTSVHAGMRGTVAAILVENGSLIDKDTVMLRIRVAS
jgi:acetyl-CoA carboxylase biotin carboxyl carrier protein